MQRFSWRTWNADIECRRHELLGGPQACPPGKFVKLDSLKCNSTRSLDRNWVTRKVFQGVKNAHKKRNIWLIWQLSVCSCSFFSWFQNGLQLERVYESHISRVSELLSRDRLHQIQILIDYHCRSPHHYNRLQVPEQPLQLLPIIISFFPIVCIT